jgi:uncharacterized membrane-anchored protein YitT (DUF2179 family)
MKKLLSIILILSLSVLALAGCGSKEYPKDYESIVLNEESHVEAITLQYSEGTLSSNTFFPIDTTDVFTIVIFSGVLSGIASGLFYKSGYVNCGFPVICKVLYENFKIAISKSTLIINIIVVIFGGVFFGSLNAMYAAILLYISSIVMDKVILGISNNKAFYIITSEEDLIKEYIIDNLHHNVTTFDVKGGFLEKKRKVLLSVIPSREYYKVTEGIKQIDKEAFFVVTDSYEVIGGK